MSSQPIVQWIYVIYFHPWGSFFSNLLHQCLEKGPSRKKERNCKSTRFVYVHRWLRDMTTHPLTKYYIIERLYFLYRLYYLSVFFYSCCYYIQYHGGIREINSMHQTPNINTGIFYYSKIFYRFNQGFVIFFHQIRCCVNLSCCYFEKILNSIVICVIIFNTST